MISLHNMMNYMISLHNMIPLIILHNVNTLNAKPISFNLPFTSHNTVDWREEIRAVCEVNKRIRGKVVSGRLTYRQSKDTVQFCLKQIYEIF